MTASAAAVDLPRFDFLYAGFALSFIAADEFGGFWARVRDRLRPGGLLAVNVFGVRDTWAGEPGLTFLDREAARALADGLDIIVFDEQEDDGDSFLGPKHWHLFDLVARRPPRPARPTA